MFFVQDSTSKKRFSLDFSKKHFFSFYFNENEKMSKYCCSFAPEFLYKEAKLVLAVPKRCKKIL
jgi:hypothetical protein